MSSPYADRVVADGASHYWRLNEASGTVATDSVGTLHGTISGGVTSGLPGPLADGSTAMLFNGTTGKVVVTTAPVTITALSLELWVKSAGSGDYTAFVSSRNALSPFLFLLGLLSHRAVLYANFGSGPQVDGVTVLDDNAWHHLVWTSDLATSRLYVDGALDVATAQVIASNTIGALTFAWDEEQNNYCSSALDEVATYPLVLTPAQVAAHYALRTAIPPEPEVPSLTLTPRLAVELAPGTWTDLTPDVIASAGIRTTRGIAGSGPLDRVAMPGVLTFTLRNDAGNSGHILGWYSPDHIAVRPGWTPGIPVKLELSLRRDAVSDLDGPRPHDRARTGAVSLPLCRSDLPRRHR